MARFESENIKGYTLVEVMVSMVIALIVLGGVYQTVTRETIDMEKQEVILDMQNNARVAIDRITMEVKRAGFFGCGGKLAANTLSNQDPDDVTLDDLLNTKTSAVNTTPGNVSFWDATTTMLAELKAGTDVDYLGVPLAFAGNAPAGHPLYDEGTDALSLVYLGGDIPLGTAMAATDTDPITLSTAAFDAGDILVVSDCENYSIFQKIDCSGTTSVLHTDAGPLPNGDCPSEPVTNLNNSADLGIAYGSVNQARAYSLEISTFFVSGSELKHNLADRIIASNIEDLQFEFLADTNGDKVLNDAWSSTFTFPTTTAVIDSQEVRAIKVWVLAMSEVVNDYTNPNKYIYAGKTYIPGDHRYRYLTTATVYLRNAGIN